MSKPRNNGLLTNARHLRKNMTPEERHLWYDFLRYCHPRFRRQEIIGNYIADFYCHEAKMIIEVDGSQHTEPAAMAYDSLRTQFLESLGILVVRYYNNDISRNFSGVCQDILTLLKAQGINPSVTFGDSSPKRGASKGESL